MCRGLLSVCAAVFSGVGVSVAMEHLCLRAVCGTCNGLATAAQLTQTVGFEKVLCSVCLDAVCSCGFVLRVVLNKELSILQSRSQVLLWHWLT